MRLAILISALVLGAGVRAAAAQDSAAARDTIAYATTALAVRERPIADAPVLGRLEIHSAVRVYGCKGGWCSVSAQHLAGYALEQHLTWRALPASRARP